MIRIAVVSRSGMPVAGAAAEFGPQGGTIGRADANTLVLSDPERTVSRLHVTVECREGRFFGIDQGSNPMQHNGKLIGAGKAVALAEGDRLTIGCFELAVSAAGGAAVAQPTSDDPFADLLSGIGAPAPASAPVAAPAPSGVSQLFPDPMAMAAAPRAAAAPVSPDDPFADLLGSDTAAPQPGAIEDFSNLGLRAPDAAAGIDHLFDSAPPSGPGRDPLGMSPLADPLLQPNTAADADPFAALQQGAPKAAPAPKADHLSVEHFGFRPPQAVVPPQGGGSLLDDPVAPLPPTPPSQQRPTPAPRACAPAGAASVAVPAAGEERHDDAIARGEVVDAVARLLDDTGGLVAEQHRDGAHAVAVHDAEVGVAHARRLDAHEQLVAPGRVQVELADGERVGRRERRPRARDLEHGSGDPHPTSSS